MKKQFLSVLLSLCMLLCIVPTAAFAASTPSGTPLTQELIERNKGYNKDEGIQLPPGDYYLTDNVYLVGDDTGAWSLLLTGGDFTLDLNGYVLDLRGANICAFGGLTLKDSSTGGKSHKFRVEESGLWVWDETNGTKTVDGGVITGGVGVTMDRGSFGGGVYVYSNLTMEGGRIVGCTAGFGGGVYMMGGSGTFTMEGGRIVGCTAGKNGGGVDVDNNSANLSTTKFTMKGGSIEDCTAANGGGVYTQNKTEFTMKGGSIQNCTAIETGGGMYASDQFTVKGGSIRNCAAADGGGLYVGNDGSTMTGGIIVDCTAAKGGGLYVGDAQFTMEGGSIENCTAAQAGGGVFVRKEYSSHFTIENGSIENCKAGGVPNAVHADGRFTDNGTTTIDKSLLSGINGGQTGTENDPILIGSADGLNDFRDRVNGIGKYSSAEPNFCAKLLCDIVLNRGTFGADGSYTGENGNPDAKPDKWTPIGTDRKPYTGTFDGDGHTVNGLYVKDQQYAGLFGYVKTDSYDSHTFAVKNLTVTGYIGVSSDSAKNVYAGGIVGCAEIVTYGGDASGTVSDCVSHVVINARSTDDVYAGGIVGYVAMDSNNHTGKMEITNCANHAAITAHSENSYVYAGGIAGQIEGTSLYDPTVQKINSCFNAGRISGGSGNYFSNYVGGIIGHATSNSAASSVDNCLNVGEVTGTAGRTYVGGIAGEVIKISISNCCNAGKVGENGGGIANHVNDAGVSNCYYLEGTADKAYGGYLDNWSKTMAEFADGTVLGLLQKGDQNSPWTKTGYLAAAGMTLPLLKWQTADAHNHNYNVQNYDNTHHWTECACGLIDKDSKAEHSATDDGNCKTAVVCKCGYEITAAKIEHNYPNDWTAVRPGTSHSHKCQNSGCGATQTKDCSGGTATCTEQATCGACHEKYGALKSHSFTAENTDEKYLKTAATCTEKAVYYKSCAVCGLSSEGTADEDTFQFGSRLDHNFGDWTSGGDGTHTHKCKNTGCTVNETKACSGGTATCKDKAICEICGVSYGAVNPANHKALKHFAAVPSTAEKEGNCEYWYCEDCGKYFKDQAAENEITEADTVTAKKAPSIISGDKTEVTQGENKELVFKSNALFADFLRVELDGETLDEKNYEKKSGSTVITLKNGFVATLSAGEHTLSIVSQSGTATASFTVKAKTEDIKPTENTEPTENTQPNENTESAETTAKSPKTGDIGNPALLIALLFVSGGAVIGTAVGKKKKNNR